VRHVASNPTLDQLLAEPGQVVADLPQEAVTPLLADLRRAVTYLEARQQAIALGNGEAGRGGEASDPKGGDRLLTVKEVAQRLGHSVDWVYRHADGLPFTVKVSRRVYFSERGYERFIQQQQGRR